jgi:hypothetical protein
MFEDVDLRRLAIFAGILLLVTVVSLPQSFMLPAVALLLVSTVAQETQRNMARDHRRFCDQRIGDATDRAMLSAAYVERVQQAGPAARLAIFNTRKILIYHCAQIIGAVNYLRYGFHWYSFAILLSCSALATLTMYRYYVKKTWLKRGIRSGALVAAPVAVHHAVLSTMKIPALLLATQRDVTTWVAKHSSGVFPSVWEDGSAVHLVFPIGFLKVYRRDRDIAVAMIAHEVGHIIQKDTELWFFAEVAGGWARAAMLALSLLQVVAAILAGVPLLLCTALLLAVSQLRYASDVSDARLASERLADVAAVLIADAASYREALSSYLTDTDTGSHEPKLLRISRVSAYVRILDDLGGVDV